ncbi:STAS domain-containing protein [Rubrivirga sp.]|uniref:STAS domain-containing protein n=1 Tax=Rubrivirga sp. TaxID=1885344 RepID=UPI003C788D74
MPAQTVRDLSITATIQRGIVIAQIDGTIDSVSSDELLLKLRTAIANGHVRIVGDMSGVQHTSSVGLRALLGAVKAARRSGGDLRLARVPPSLEKVLEMSGFTTIFRLYDDVDSALASYDA